MSGLLANLVGAATTALNLRTADSTARGPREPGSDNGFASALSAALAPRERSEAPPRASEEAVVSSAEAADEARESRAAAARADSAERRDRARESRESVEAATETTTTLDDAAPETTAETAVDGPGPSPAAARVTNSLENLNPEFRERLERVIARMEGEYGHRVSVVETLRNQTRQDQLFAQGRTRPGPVVTWTRNSNHLSGRAADLLVDGTYDNPLAMVRLARIAREEGLRTLGARDPGHVELPRGVRMERMAVSVEGTSQLLDGAASRAGDAARAALVSQAGAGSDAGAGVAHLRVARVATVAQVAQVATVARVATPGAPGAAAVDAPAAAASQEQPAAVLSGRAGGEGSHASNEDHGQEGGGPYGEQIMDSRPELSSRAPAAAAGNEGRAGGAGEARGASGAFGAEAAERIARVLQLQDTSPTRPLSQMVLRLDNALGGEDQIRVDLRGTAVGASLSVNDPVTAARLQSELGQLQKALEGRGLQAEHLSVSGALAGRELAEAIRTSLPGDAGQRAWQDTGSQKDGGSGRSGGRQPGSEADHPRQQPRKNNQQERNS